MNNLTLEVPRKHLFNLLFICFLVFAGTAVYTETIALLVIPFIIVAGIWLLRDLKAVYYMMIMSIPLSVALYTGSFSFDMPDELFNILFLFILPGFLLSNRKSIDLSFLRHPIVIILMTMYAVSVITTMTSVNVFFSVKYLLAKAWYLVAYFGFTAYFMKTWQDVRKLALLAGAAGFVTLVYVMVRHAGYGFSFADINYVVGPFYSNHVNYAIQLMVILPFIWMLGRLYKLNTLKTGWIISGVIFLYVIAIYFSFTRAAIGAVVLAIPFYFIIKWKLAVPAIIISLIGVASYTVWLIKDNRFFDLAPDYNKTISHQNFDQLLTATVNLEDISTMERVHRWVAARYMIADKPLLGVGPNNFYDTYKAYTLRSFQTYVSDNPDKSTVHSYVLLLAIEQGIVSALLFIGLICYAIVIGQRLYHAELNPHNRQVVMAALICLFLLFVVLSINDVVESDKEGSFFYISLGLLAGFHWRHHKRKQAEQRKSI